jgi:lipoate---protein ligase
VNSDRNARIAARTGQSSPFELLRWRGSAGEFHARPFPDPPSPQVWVFEVDRPAVVLGSTQPDDVVDAAAACAAAGVEVVRRRSGGGVVLLEPGGIVWFDVIVPAALLHGVGVGDDVAASMIWLGDHVVAALAELGVSGQVHRGRMVCSSWCPLVCFAGIGPGEVTLGGAKLVGISQRRTRAGSRFQCAVHTRWLPENLVRLLAEPRPSVSELPPVAALADGVARALPETLASAFTA